MNVDKELISRIQGMDDETVALFLALEKELKDLRNAVREWVCPDCDIHYPGPPHPGYDAVICPRCGEATVPYVTHRERKAIAKADSLSAELDAERQGHAETKKRLEFAMRMLVGAAWECLSGSDPLDILNSLLEAYGDNMVGKVVQAGRGMRTGDATKVIRMEGELDQTRRD